MADNKTTPGAEIKSGPVVCGHCKRTLAYLSFDEIGTIEQLRVGTLQITSIEGNCIYCGQPFRWKIREKDIQRIAITYGQILRRDGYIPE